MSEEFTNKQNPTEADIARLAERISDLQSRIKKLVEMTGGIKGQWDDLALPYAEDFSDLYSKDMEPKENIDPVPQDVSDDWMQELEVEWEDEMKQTASAEGMPRAREVPLFYATPLGYPRPLFRAEDENEEEECLPCREEREFYEAVEVSNYDGRSAREIPVEVAQKEIVDADMYVTPHAWDTSENPMEKEVAADIRVESASPDTPKRNVEFAGKDASPEQVWDKEKLTQVGATVEELPVEEAENDGDGTARQADAKEVKDTKPSDTSTQSTTSDEKTTKASESETDSVAEVEAAEPEADTKDTAQTEAETIEDAAKVEPDTVKETPEAKKAEKPAAAVGTSQSKATKADANKGSSDSIQWGKFPNPVNRRRR